MSNIKIKENETFEEYEISKSNQSKSLIEKRGRKKGSEKLSKEEQLEILNLLKDYPIFYNLNMYYMWSSKSIQQLIMLKLDIYFPLSSIRDYLNRWFDIKEKEKGNRIKKLIDNNSILKNTCNDVVTYLYIKKHKDGFLHIITRANENKFIYCGNKNQKNLIKAFKYLIDCYKDKNIYLLFDSFFYDETIFNKLLNRNLKIFYIKNNFIASLKNEKSRFDVNEFKISKKKKTKTKKTNTSSKPQDEILVDEIDFDEEKLVSFPNQLESTDNISEGIEINSDIYTKLINDLE